MSDLKKEKTDITELFIKMVKEEKEDALKKMFKVEVEHRYAMNEANGYLMIIPKIKFKIKSRKVYKILGLEKQERKYGE